LTNLLEKLKTETLSNHQQLEKNLILRLKGMDNTADYIKILQIFYGYFSALENQINKYIGAEQLPDHAERRKTLSIKNDLQALQGAVPEQALGVDLPEITNKLQAFGALYVIEGSTLGGQIISKMISKQLGMDTDAGLSFFKSYGEETMPMWSTFKNTLEQQASTPQAVDDLVNAANETFLKFSHWMDKF
jgi:heme oxygenase